MILTKEKAQEFAKEWIDAWNSHDLDRVLSHYTDDFEMSSPLMLRMYPDSGGTLKGKDAVGSYWRAAMEKYPDLRFEFHEVLFSVNTICIYYTSILDLHAVEWLKFNDDGLVSHAAGHYND